ncbi:MAG: trypsin-like peptidase domain-containing protein [Candidatus Uhrbacteria bacterium]
MRSIERDTRILILAGAIGLIVGGLAGIAGGLFVSTGRLAPLRRLITVPISSMRTLGSDQAPETAATPQMTDDAATIAVVRAASPAVVSVIVRKEVNAIARGNSFSFPDFFEFGIPLPFPQPESTLNPKGEKQQVGAGSGFIVTSNGFIVTNRHVVEDEKAEYSVVVSDDKELPAKVVARDPVNDIAILKVDIVEALPVLPLGDSDKIEIGETVIAIGNALSEFRNTVTKGVISGRNRRVVAGDGLGSSEVINEAIQTDAAINPGNSGGPLLNLNGEVIGVNTAVSNEGQLIGFAIPINTVRQAINSVLSEGKIVRPWLGVRYLMVTKELAESEHLKIDYGALVVHGPSPAEVAVASGSPAERAGLRDGDIVAAVDEEKVDKENPLAAHIARHKAGDRIKITFWRNSDKHDVGVVLGEFPAS